MKSSRSSDGPIRIATRKSELAMQQARLVASALDAQGARAEIVPFQTVGDTVLDRPLAQVGTKGAFTRELEEALRAGDVDCCVHSLKDLPTESPAGLRVGAVLRREDPRDALVVRPGIPATSIETLPVGTRIGTSSPRRRVQLAAIRPELEIVDLRGNVQTRIAKVHSGVVDATILAFAGVRRLSLAQHVAGILDAPTWLPAPGQGAIAIQIRCDDLRLRQFADALNHRETLVAVEAERAFLAAFEGGCQLPLGALATIDPTESRRFLLHGVVEDPDTGRLTRQHLTFAPSGSIAAGRHLAALVRAEQRDGGRLWCDRARPLSPRLSEIA